MSGLRTVPENIPSLSPDNALLLGDSKLQIREVPIYVNQVSYNQANLSDSRIFLRNFGVDLQ